MYSFWLLFDTHMAYSFPSVHLNEVTCDTSYACLIFFESSDFLLAFIMNNLVPSPDKFQMLLSFHCQDRAKTIHSLAITKERIDRGIL